MKFFILGDSWGVGEWRQTPQGFQPVPNTGVGYWLELAGHSVTNIAAGSAGNFGQLRHAYWTLHNHSDYDYIIWFYTESVRDIEEHCIKDPQEAQIQYPDFDARRFSWSIQYIQKRNFEYAQTLFDRYKIPFVIVGGQSIVPQWAADYDFVTYCIHSWLAELLNLPNDPPEHTFASWQKLQRVLDHYSISQRQYLTDHLDDFDAMQQIERLARASPLFPDNGHPNAQCHRQLAHRIIELIANAGQ